VRALTNGRGWRSLRFPHVRLNREMAHYVCAYKGSAKKRMHTLMVWLRVVRLSLALPGWIAWDAPSLSRPDYYGMEPASPGRLSFHASAFASVPDVSELPPRIRCPLRAGARTSPAQAAMTTSPKPISWMGRPHCSAAFCAADSMLASCIKVYAARGSMMRRLMTVAVRGPASYQM